MATNPFEKAPAALPKAEKPTLLGRHHHRGKSMGAASHPEKSVHVAGVASPARRRQRTKTWTAPRALEKEQEEDSEAGPPQNSGSEGGMPVKSCRSLTWASEFLMLDEATEQESAPQHPPTSPAGPRRKTRRCKTWTERAQVAEEPDVKEAPVLVPTVSPAGRRPQRRKTWTAQLSPAEQSTPSMISSRPTFSQESETLSRASSFSEGLTPPIEDNEDDDFRVSAGFGWIQGQKIGSGSYGCVYKALDKETGRIFAVKKALIEEQSEEDRKYRDMLAQELEIYKELRHPNVVSYLGHDYADSHLYIYLAYVSGGSLSSFLSEFGPVKGVLLQTGTRGLVEGLSYLHTRSPPIVHRDIKGANILVDLNFCLKLADFGCSKRSSDTKSFTTLGSVPWMAPEVIQQQDGHGRKADVWSLGCTIIEMATADKPWGKDTFDNMMFALRHIALSDATPPTPDDLPDGGADFLAACLQRTASQRPSATELLGHEFISDSPSRAGLNQCKAPAARGMRF